MWGERTVCGGGGCDASVARQPENGRQLVAKMWTNAAVESGHTSGTTLFERELVNTVERRLLSSGPTAFSACFSRQSGVQRTAGRCHVYPVGTYPAQRARARGAAGLEKQAENAVGPLDKS